MKKEIRKIAVQLTEEGFDKEEILGFISRAIILRQNLFLSDDDELQINLECFSENKNMIEFETADDVYEFIYNGNLFDDMIFNKESISGGYYYLLKRYGEDFLEGDYLGFSEFETVIMISLLVENKFVTNYDETELICIQEVDYDEDEAIDFLFRTMANLTDYSI
jgi:hypothetical protein